MFLKNRTYNALKFVALVFLPALASAYFSLAQAIHLPNAEQVVGVLTVVDTFLGLLLKSSTTQYNKTVESGNTTDGVLVVAQDEEDGQKYLTLHVAQNTIDTLESRQTVTLSVADQAVQSKPQ